MEITFKQIFLFNCEEQLVVFILSEKTFPERMGLASISSWLAKGSDFSDNHIGKHFKTSTVLVRILLNICTIEILRKWNILYNLDFDTNT